MDKTLHIKEHMPLRQTSVHFTPEVYAWLRTEANLHHVSMSKLVNDAVAAQRALRRQGAGYDGTNGAGALLERTTAEVAATLDRQAAEIAALREQLGQALVMLDRAFYAYLLHTPTVAEAAQPQARAEALRRYEKWVTEVRALGAPRKQEPQHGRTVAAPATPGAPERKAST